MNSTHSESSSSSEDVDIKGISGNLRLGKNSFKRDYHHSEEDLSNEEEGKSETDDGSSSELFGGTDKSDEGSDEDSQDGCGLQGANEIPPPPLSIAERIQRQEGRGVDMRRLRERKSVALKIANERLGKLRREKKGEEAGGDAAVDNGSPQKKKKKKSKHAPTEASSKRADFYSVSCGGCAMRQRELSINERGIGVDVGAHRYRPRDPRQSSLTGHVNAQQLDHKYAFLREMRDGEIAQLRKRIDARTSTGKRGQHLRKRMGISGEATSSAAAALRQDEQELQRLLQEKSNLERNQLERAAKRALKKKLEQQVSEGQSGVYFLKRKEKKRLLQEEKLNEIRKRGGDQAVEKAIAKRRKRNKSRDAGRFQKSGPM